MNRFWPVRHYPWGTCEALSSIHSDLASLKKLLFEVMYEELKQQTEHRYYKFRQNTLFNLDDPNRSSFLPSKNTGGFLLAAIHIAK